MTYDLATVERKGHRLPLGRAVPRVVQRVPRGWHPNDPACPPPQFVVMWTWEWHKARLGRCKWKQSPPDILSATPQGAEATARGAYLERVALLDMMTRRRARRRMERAA